MKKEESDPVLFTITFQFILTLVVLAYALIMGFEFPPPSFLWPRLLLSAVLYAVGSLCNFYASRHLPAGENSILAASGILITIGLGVTVLGNTFSLFNSIGVLLILASIIILYGGGRMRFNRGVLYALGVAVFYSLAVINDVIIIRSYNPISFLPVMSFLPGVVLAFIFPKKAMKIGKLMNRKSLSHIVVYSVFYGISAITYYQALYTGASISQLSPISRASIIITVILGALFLGERDNLVRKVMSAVLVSEGVLLLA
jgi:transporter family protein